MSCLFFLLRKRFFYQEFVWSIFPGEEVMDLKEEDILGEKIQGHWYYLSKGKALKKFIGDIKVSEVLDVGAGSGIFSKKLLDDDVCDSAVCVDPNYAVEKTESHNGKPMRFVKKIDTTSQELILMMDVLEHVENDLQLLKNYVDSMKPGGYVLITVPAFQFMWSGHDVFLEHYRRYTIRMVEALTQKAGLKPVKSRYFFGSLFPILATSRVFKNILFNRGKFNAKSELKLYPNWLNQMLITVHSAECNSFFNFNRLFGLSVFCLCRKN